MIIYLSRMSLLLWRAGKFIDHWWNAKTRHGTHSPFMYELLDQVVYDDRHFYAFNTIEKRRNELLSDNTVIDILDLGAGSSINASNKRMVSDIAKNSLKTTELGQLMFRLVNRFQPNNMVELGTSLGISTLYQSLAYKHGCMHTLEGCKETARIAQQTFDSVGSGNIKLHLGDFEETLPKLLQKIEKVDWAFVDGNHQYGPTMNYFHQLMYRSHEGTVLVFDDIYWSKGMAQAWEEIKAHGQVTCTLDLFHVGIVFLHKGQKKENFRVKF